MVLEEGQAVALEEARPTLLLGARARTWLQLMKVMKLFVKIDELELRAVFKS